MSRDGGEHTCGSSRCGRLIYARVADTSPDRGLHLVPRQSSLEVDSTRSLLSTAHAERDDVVGPPIPASSPPEQTSLRAPTAGQHDRDRVGINRKRRSEAPEPATLPHRHYITKTASLARCDNCNEVCGANDEIYQCTSCTAQICRGCVEGKLDNEDLFGLVWDWQGTQHLPFKEAYLHRKRKATGEFGEGNWIGAVQLSGVSGVTPVELRMQRLERVSEEPPVAVSSAGGNGVGGNNSALGAGVRWQTLVNHSGYFTGRSIFTVGSEDWRQLIQQSSIRLSFRDRFSRVSSAAAMAETTMRSIPTIPYENGLRDRRRPAQGLSLRASNNSNESRLKVIEPQQDIDIASTNISPYSQATIDDPDLSSKDSELLAGRDLALRTYDTVPPPRSTQAPPPVGTLAMDRGAERPSPRIGTSYGRDTHTNPAEYTQVESETTRRARVVPSVSQTPSQRRPLPPILPASTSSLSSPETLPGAHASYTGYISTPNFYRQLHPRAILAVDPLTNQTYRIPIIQPPPVMTTFNTISPLYGGVPQPVGGCGQSRSHTASVQQAEEIRAQRQRS